MSFLRRTGSRLASTVLFIAVLAAGYGIATITPDLAAEHRPFLIGGNLSEPIQTRLFEVKVTGVKFGSSVKVAGSLSAKPSPLATGGVWVLIHVKFSANSKPTRINYAALVSADGRTFLATDRVDQKIVIGGRELQPGIPAEGDALFEIPKSAATAGLVARFAAAEKYDVRKDAMAEVVLVPDGAAVFVDTSALAYDPAVKA
jgi:hypothetical protein